MASPRTAPPQLGSTRLPAVGELAAADGAPSGWFQRLIGWIRRHPTLADTALGVLLFALTLPTMVDPDPALYPDGVREADALGVALLVGMTLPLGLRRRWPVPVLVVVEAATIPYLALNYTDAIGTIGMIIALYSVAANCERRTSLRAAAATFVPFALLLVVGVLSTTERLPPSAAMANAVMWWGAFGIGDAFRSRRAYVAELQLRVETADRLHQEESATAVAAERTRIARELHDVVAHGMSVMVVQAGAARAVLDKHPDQAAEALGAIERTGREAMAEMRRLLGVLRDEAEGLAGPGLDGRDGHDEGTIGPAGRDLAPQPGLAALPDLVRSWADAGMPVRLELGCDDASDLPPGADLAAYRIAQEALTNVARHAGLVHDVVVRVDRVGTTVTLDVTDDGRGAATGAVRAATDPGHGLLGMRERAALYGGTVTAGPQRSGGWQVHAEISVGDAAGHPVGGRR